MADRELVIGPSGSAKLDRIKSLHSLDLSGTQHSGARGPPIWMPSDRSSGSPNECGTSFLMKPSTPLRRA